MATARLVSDAQKDLIARSNDGFRWGNPAAEARVAELLAGLRAAGLPVTHIRHQASDPADGFHPDNPVRPRWQPPCQWVMRP